MTRTLIPGAFFGDHLPTGEYCATIPRVGIQTHLGLIPLPPGESWGIGYPRCTNVFGFRFAGQAHVTIEPACWEWSTPDWGGWHAYPQPCCGQSPVIYDGNGILRRAECAPPTGSQGWRFIGSPSSVPPAFEDWGGVTGDQTYGPWNGLSEYTDLGDGLWIGQAHDFLAAVVFDGVQLRLLEAGACTFIRANRAGEAVALAFSRPEGVVLMSTTMAELRALPPVVTEPPPVEPPVPPDPPVPPEPPVQPPIPLYHRHRRI